MPGGGGKHSREGEDAMFINTDYTMLVVAVGAEVGLVAGSLLRCWADSGSSYPGVLYMYSTVP